jgi:hypothetical protein
MSKLGANIKVGARHIVTIPIISRQGASDTQYYMTGLLKGRWFVESADHRVDETAASAGTGTPSCTLVKTSNYSAYTAMGDVADPTATVGARSAIDVFGAGDSGTEYDIGGNKIIDGRAIVESGQAVGVKIITAGGEENAVATVTLILQELATTAP